MLSTRGGTVDLARALIEHLKYYFPADRHFLKNPTRFVNIFYPKQLTRFQVFVDNRFNSYNLYSLARPRRYDLRTFGPCLVDRLVDLEHVSNRRQGR